VNTVDPEEEEMKRKCDENDKVLQEKIDKLTEENNKVSGFKKLLPYNNPSYFIFIGCFCALFTGASMPVVGVILSELLTYMTAPFELLDLMAISDPDFEGTGRDYLESNVNFFSLIMGIISIAIGFTSYYKGISFGKLGSNVTE
jgi:hypothetical protein